MRTIIAAALAGLFLAGQALADPTPEERYARAANVLAQGCRGTGCDFGVETPEEKTALGAAWVATQDWTVAFFESHRGLSEERLQTEFLNRRTNVAAPVNIVPLKPGLNAVFTQYGEMGNVFLVGERNGHFAVVWDIRNADPTKFSILNAWRTDQDNKFCRTREDAWSGLCGPLFATNIKPLPPDEEGHLRFALDATYAQAAETTVGAQLSVWSLDGATPHLQWAKRYAYNFEDVAWKQRGNLHKIRTTEWWHTIFACGSCVGRQMDWTLRIRPDGIDDLGMEPVVPELDAFDELAWRVFKGENVDDLAKPKVHRILKSIVNDQKSAAKDLMGKDYDPKWFSFGMLAGFDVRHVAGGSELCLITDEIGFWVRFAKRPHRWIATDLRQLPEPDSKFCRKSAP